MLPWLLEEHLRDSRTCMRRTAFLWFVVDPAIAHNDAKDESADGQVAAEHANGQEGLER